jgi:hypothetical protein
METGIKNLQSADVRQFPWLEAMVAALDDRLRVRHGVIEYTNSPECLFRIQLAASNDDYVLSDGTCIRAGDRVVNLHVWNEQFPYFTGKGPTLAWARRVNQAFEISLRELAGFLDARSDLDDVIAICANMTFQPVERSAQLTRFVSRFGFERIAAASSRSIPPADSVVRREHPHLDDGACAQRGGASGPTRCGATAPYRQASPFCAWSSLMAWQFAGENVLPAITLAILALALAAFCPEPF